MENEDFNTIDKKYTIITKIYEGNLSKVYLAEDLTTKKKYAIKSLEKQSDFEKELSIVTKVSKLNNPYIINYIDHGEEYIKKNSSKKNKYIIFEYASNGDFYDYIEVTKKGLEEIYAKFIFKKILDGVQAIHESGICHRDLKMNNILVDEFFNPKICDFGFATETQGKNGPLKLTEYLGTTNYAAPEMYENKPYDGVKADIFSLGVILLNIVRCKIGFLDANYNDYYYIYIIKKNYNDYWKIVEKLIGKVPEQVKKLYFKMVAYKPNERPSIKEILEDPWMKEIKDLKDEEYKKLEEQVNKKFKELDKEVKKKNETVNTNKTFNQTIKIKENKDLSENEFEKEYFKLDLTPKYILQTGLNMKHYIKINGDLNPAGFMNSLANEIKNKYGDKCKIEENEQKLKFKIIFENSEKFEEEYQNEKEEEIKNIEKEKSNDADIFIERKGSIIQIKLFESVNGGYIVRFARNQGKIEDFLKYMDDLKMIIKNIL